MVVYWVNIVARNLGRAQMASFFPSSTVGALTFLCRVLHITFPIQLFCRLCGKFYFMESKVVYNRENEMLHLTGHGNRMWEQRLISLDVGSCIASFINMTDGNYSLLCSSKTKKSSFMKTITSFVRLAVLTLKHTSINDRDRHLGKHVCSKRWILLFL